MSILKHSVFGSVFVFTYGNIYTKNFDEIQRQPSHIAVSPFTVFFKFAEFPTKSEMLDITVFKAPTRLMPKTLHILNRKVEDAKNRSGYGYKSNSKDVSS